MPFYWLMPNYHSLVLVEIDDGLHWLEKNMSKPFRDTLLKYGLLDPERQAGVFFAALMVISLIWIMVLQFLSRLHPCPSPAVSSPVDEHQVPDKKDPQTLIATGVKADEFASSLPGPPLQSEAKQAMPPQSGFVTTFAKMVGASDQCPVNANSADAPTRVADLLAIHMATKMGHRTQSPTACRIRTPPQTPISSSTKKVPSIMPYQAPSSARLSTTSAESFSRVNKDAMPIRDNDPVLSAVDDAYRAMVMKSNFLFIKDSSPRSFASALEDGSPTKKFVDRQVLKNRLEHIKGMKNPRGRAA